MAIFTIAIIAATSLISFYGFRNSSLYNRGLFSTNGILGQKEYYRVITSVYSSSGE